MINGKCSFLEGKGVLTVSIAYTLLGDNKSGTVEWRSAGTDGR